MSVAEIALAIALLGLLLYALARFKARVKRLKKAHTANLLRQLDALNALHDELKFHARLPPFPNAAGRPDFLLELARHALDARPRVVLECGSGLSTVILARCLQGNGTGHLYSLEHDPECVRHVNYQLIRQGLSEWATVLEAPLEPVTLTGETWPWYATEKLPDLQIDMLVIDGPPGRIRRHARYPAGPLVFPRLTPGAVAFLDDAKRRKEQRILKRWAREFPHLRQEFLACEKGVAKLLNTPRAYLT